MKKKGLLLGLVACIATALSAQTHTEDKTSLYGIFDTIPRECTNAGKMMLYLTEYDDSCNYTAHFYDQDLKKIKMVNLNLPIKKGYYMVKVRESEIRRTHEDVRLYSIYGDTTNIISREEIIEYLTQRADTVYEDKDGIMWFVESFYEEHRCAENYTHTSYPENGYYLTVDNKIFRFSYNYKKFYDGEWKQEMKTESSDIFNYISGKSPQYMYICGMANGITTNYKKTDWTQSLFNNDTKMEYFYITEEPKADSSREYDNDNDGVIDSISTSYSYYPTKIELKQEDGTVLFTHNISKEYTSEVYPYFFRLNNRDYLLIEEYNYHQDENSFRTATIYTVDKSTSTIAKVNSIKGLRAWPNPAEKEDTRTMELPESQNENVERDIRVTSTDGRLMWRQRVLSEKRFVQIPLRGMHSGIYSFTVTEGDRIIKLDLFGVDK